MSMDIDDGVVGAVARRLGTENNLSSDDVDALCSIIKARLSKNQAPYPRSKERKLYSHNGRTWFSHYSAW